MSDRLAHLRRQRALAQEQLDWINREIAEAEAPGGQKPIAAVPKTKETAPALVSAGVPVPLPATSATAATPEDEEIIARYRVGTDALQKDVRRGCFIYFAVALFLLAVGVAILYFTLRSS